MDGTNWNLSFCLCYCLPEDPQLDIFNTTGPTKATLRNLDKFTNYSIQVLGFTLVGDGAASKPVHCVTEEDGNKYF